MDNLLDLAIDRLIDHLEGKLLDINTDPPVEPPTEDEPPYDQLFSTTPDPLMFPDGSTLWERRTVDPTGGVTKQYRVLKGVYGYPGEVQVGVKENEAWTIF